MKFMKTLCQTPVKFVCSHSKGHCKNVKMVSKVFALSVISRFLLRFWQHTIFYELRALSSFKQRVLGFLQNVPPLLSMVNLAVTCEDQL
jgi:hypothetical protein